MRLPPPVRRDLRNNVTTLIIEHHELRTGPLADVIVDLRISNDELRACYSEQLTPAETDCLGFLYLLSPFDRYRAIRRAKVTLTAEEFWAWIQE